MNWFVFALTAYLFVAIQSGLTPIWTVAGTTPNLLLILAVFVGVSAGRTTVMWALLIIGLLLDLLPGPLSEQGVILGPHAVGYLVGAYAVLQLRNLMFRDSLPTIALMVFAVGGFAALMETVLYAFRGLPWLAGEPLGADWGATRQLWRRVEELIYTAVLAVPLGLALRSTKKFWGFASRPRNERVF